MTYEQYKDILAIFAALNQEAGMGVILDALIDVASEASLLTGKKMFELGEKLQELKKEFQLSGYYNNS